MCEQKAERPGFEPGVPHGTTVFETAPINRSGTSPIVFNEHNGFSAMRTRPGEAAQIPPEGGSRQRRENRSGTSPTSSVHSKQ